MLFSFFLICICQMMTKKKEFIFFSFLFFNFSAWTKQPSYSHLFFRYSLSNVIKTAHKIISSIVKKKMWRKRQKKNYVFSLRDHWITVPVHVFDGGSAKTILSHIHGQCPEHLKFLWNQKKIKYCNKSQIL